MSIPHVEQLVQEHWGTREIAEDQRQTIVKYVMEYLDKLLPERDISAPPSG